MARIALVSCSATKLKHKAPARELYISPLFRASYAYAEKTCDRVVIVSALYGALEPDRIVEPYDFELRERSSTDRASWGVRTICQARQASDGTAPVFVILAGGLYTDALNHGARWNNLPTPEMPLGALRGVGNRIRWLKENTARDPRASTSAAAQDSSPRHPHGQQP